MDFHKVIDQKLSGGREFGVSFLLQFFEAVLELRVIFFISLMNFIKFFLLRGLSLVYFFEEVVGKCG